MTNPSIVAGLSKRNGMRANSLSPMVQLAPRRTGGTLWERPIAGERLIQPQDGAPVRTKLAAITSHLQGNIFKEPEDAGLTGGTRSLARRLLGLNLRNKARKAPVMNVMAAAHPKVA